VFRSATIGWRSTGIANECAISGTARARDDARDLTVPRRCVGVDDETIVVEVKHQITDVSFTDRLTTKKPRAGGEPSAVGNAARATMTVFRMRTQKINPPSRHADAPRTPSLTPRSEGCWRRDRPRWWATPARFAIFRRRRI